MCALLVAVTVMSQLSEVTLGGKTSMAVDQLAPLGSDTAPNLTRSLDKAGLDDQLRATGPSKPAAGSSVTRKLAPV